MGQNVGMARAPSGVGGRFGRPKEVSCGVGGRGSRCPGGQKSMVSFRCFIFWG